ncbi:hypothetical protein ACFQ7A_11375 [Streptomyces sp. NPDC056528]|uniref:hypothetical protein n=1 Tax=Streptomyces sp. NPDC056528 TaxID=3345854 RepID=UPI003678F7D2
MTSASDLDGHDPAGGTARRALERVLASASGPGRVLRAMDRLERATALDGPAERLGEVVRSVPLGRGRDVLHGRRLGHPVHPVRVQVPVGAWFSAVVLDPMPEQRRAASTLIGRGKAPAFAGLTAVGVGGALGGHLPRPGLTSPRRATDTTAGAVGGTVATDRHVHRSRRPPSPVPACCGRVPRGP